MRPLRLRVLVVRQGSTSQRATMSASVVPTDQSWRRAGLFAAMLAGGVEPTHFHDDGQARVRSVASQTTRMLSSAPNRWPVAEKVPLPVRLRRVPWKVAKFSVMLEAKVRGS